MHPVACGSWGCVIGLLIGPWQPQPPPPELGQLWADVYDDDDDDDDGESTESYG